MIFLALQLAAVFASIDPMASLTVLRKIPFLLIFFPSAYFAWRFEDDHVGCLLQSFVFSAMVASLYGATVVLATDFYRLQSTTSGPATLATLLACGFIIGLALLLGKELKPASFWLCGLLAVLWIMAYTYCRAPWFSAVAVALVMLHRWRRRLLAAMAIALTLLLVVPGLEIRYAEILQTRPNWGDRPVLWQAALQRLKERPAGSYGPGTFHLLFDRREQLHDKRAGAWHNMILQIWIESGVVAAMLFIGIVYRTIQLGWREMKMSAAPTTRAVLSALLSASVILLFTGMFGGLIGDPLLDLLFWSMVGMIAGIRARRIQAVPQFIDARTRRR